jgi:hypothetical protein
MKIQCYILVISSLLYACNRTQTAKENKNNQNEHSLKSEMKVLRDISSLPQYLDNTLCAQVSSWDTTGGNDDGFSGTFSFLRKNADGTLVIFDTQGSGVINRIWTPTPNSDTLDFYIDNNDHPAFSVQFMDLFSGKRFPFVAPLCGNQLGGYYCYIPIPFEKSCKIVSRGKNIQFHQIQYRMYANGAKVKSFNPDLTADEKEELEKIALLWNKKSRNIKDFYPGLVQEASEQLDIEPGKTVTAFELNHGGRILGIELDPVNAFEGLHKNIDLKITWDKENNPAVFCPVADFFGYAFGKASMQSLLLGSRDSRNYCYFPMPFDSKAKIELVYRRDESSSLNPIKVSIHVLYSSEKRDPENEGKFYTHWNKNNPQPGLPHIFLNVKGKGHYVGTILQAQGKKPGMTYFFEGDDSASIDGVFRIHGTGSEDYFNGGWYALMDRWDGNMSLPLHGALDYSLPFCRTGGYRLYISDKLSFENHFFLSIEHGPVGNKVPVDYTSLALYYCDTPVEEYTKPTHELTTIFIPDTLIIYPQLMNYNFSGNMDLRTTWKYGTGGLSFLFTPLDKAYLRISLADIPRNTYSVFFDIMKEPFGCDFSLWKRQSQISEWIPTYQPVEGRDEKLYVCDLDLDGYINTITIQFKTDLKKRSLLLNRIMLIKNIRSSSTNSK